MHNEQFSCNHAFEKLQKPKLFCSPSMTLGGNFWFARYYWINLIAYYQDDLGTHFWFNCENL